MDYEKKYKNALAHAREIHRNEEGKRKDMEFLFPELKGIDDEEIKEEIINYFECQSRDEPTRKDIHNKWIAWLKRQDRKPQGNTYTFEGKSVLEAINEEKVDNANKVVVEPKFKVGDWVVVSTTKGDKVVQIASIEYFKDGHPSYTTTEGRWFGNGTKARLLTDKDVETITLPESKLITHKDKEKQGNPTDNNIKEALCTEYEKGRADAFAEMQKEWSEEDEEMLEDVRDNFEYNKGEMTDSLIAQYDKFFDKIKFLKPQPKQEWSEEDDKKRKGLIKGLEDRMGFGWASDPFSREEYISWLKSLIPQNRWKPSEEQMKALCFVKKAKILDPEEREALNSLYIHLRELK